jgi:hypothetical protein
VSVMPLAPFAGVQAAIDGRAGLHGDKIEPTGPVTQPDLTVQAAGVVRRRRWEHLLPVVNAAVELW